MIETIKLILGNNIDDVLCEFYINTAKDMIISHLNLNYLEDGLYENAIIMLVVYLYNNATTLGISTRKEGDISISLENLTIPSQIKAMLPKPKVRFL